MSDRIIVPRYYKPRPYQQEAWKRRMSNRYNFYFKLWPRQCFTGDTLAYTPEGLKRIDSLVPGDRVFSFSDTDGIVVREVKDTWLASDDKPVIKIGGTNGGVGLSYDHPVYCGRGSYQELYRVIWRAMDAGQRKRLQILCERHGQSIDDESVRTRKNCIAQGVSDGKVSTSWMRLSTGKTISGIRDEGCKGTQTGSRTLHTESGQPAASEPYQQKPAGQSSCESGMGHERGQSQVVIQPGYGEGFGDPFLMGIGERIDQRAVLPDESEAVRRDTELYKIRVEWSDLEIAEPEQLYDIEIDGEHNLFIGLSGILVHNCGKDTDDIEFCLFDAWKTPGTQTAYVGLDNKWVGTNIFNKYIDGRRFWEDFPREHINVRDTQKEVTFSNHPDDMAEARVKFIGFQNDQAMIGSSYDRFYISEASLYGQNAFQFIEPIWENKLATGENLRVYINGTPRGMQNVYTQMLQNYTGEKDPEAFKGEHIIGHYSTYVDRLTVEDIYIPDGEGGWRRLYDDGWIEVMKQRYLDAYGNLNLFLQEFYCDFTTVNSGLVYQGVEQMEKQGRITDFNLDTSKPVYVAFDISSKDKITDATVGLVYQYIGNKTLVYDMIELRGMALVQVVAQLATKGYWPYIRVGFLPWDSDRSASSETPLEEVERMYPNVTWHALEKERIDRGIQVVREAMPNMWIHRDNCRRLVESLHAYEYKRLEKQDDWSATPYHNWASHACDALRYACMGIEEMEYLGLPMDGSRRKMPSNYEYFGDIGNERPSIPITMMTEKQRREWMKHGRFDTGDGDKSGRYGFGGF